MEIEEELLKIFNSFIFSNNCKLIKVKYDPTFFGNFLLEIQYGKFSFRIINDRDQLFIEKYDEIAAEWNDVGSSRSAHPESEFQRIYIDMYIDLELTTNFSALRTDVNGMLSRGVSSEPLLPEGSATPDEYVLACIALAALEDLQTKESRLESSPR